MLVSRIMLAAIMPKQQVLFSPIADEYCMVLLLMGLVIRPNVILSWLLRHHVHLSCNVRV